METLLEGFDHKEIRFEAGAADYYHPGCSARVLLDGVLVAQCGQLNPQAAATRKIRPEVFPGKSILMHSTAKVRVKPFTSLCPSIQRWIAISLSSLMTLVS